MNVTGIQPRKAGPAASLGQVQGRTGAGKTISAAQLRSLGMCGDDQIKAKAKDGRLLSDLDSDGCAAATTWVEGETAMLMADVDGDGNFQSDGDICNSSRIKLSSASEPFRMLCRSARTPVCVKLIATHVVSIWTEIRFHLTIRRCCFSPCLPSARNRVRRWHQHPTSRIEEHFNEKNAHCPDFFNVCCYEF